MQEFSSISVSSYEAGVLADRLTEQSAQGWEVVSIVPTGSTVTAYLSRASGTGDEHGTGEAVAGIVDTAPAEPESATESEHGHDLLANFLELAGLAPKRRNAKARRVAA